MVTDTAHISVIFLSNIIHLNIPPDTESRASLLLLGVAVKSCALFTHFLYLNTTSFT